MVKKLGKLRGNLWTGWGISLSLELALHKLIIIASELWVGVLGY